MKNKAYVLRPELAKRVDKIKKEMGAKDESNVILKALELLDISMGRKVILKDAHGGKSYEIDDLEEYHQTLIID